MPVFTDPLWESVIHWKFNGRHCANVIHHRQIIDTAPVAPESILSGWLDGTLIPNLSALQSSSVEYQAYTVKRLGPGIPTEPIPYSPTTANGLVAGDPLPGNVAMCFTKRSGYAGRKYRGRFFLGGLSENDASGNLYQGIINHPLGILNFIAAMKSTIAGAFKPVITGRVWNDAHTQWEGVDVVDFLIRDTELDSQRGRLRGP